MVAEMLLKQYMAAQTITEISRLHSTDTAELMWNIYLIVFVLSQQMHISGNAGLGNRVFLGKLFWNHGGYLTILEERDTCKEKDSEDKFISVPSSEGVLDDQGW